MNEFRLFVYSLRVKVKVQLPVYSLSLIFSLYGILHHVTTQKDVTVNMQPLDFGFFQSQDYELSKLPRYVIYPDCDIL